MTSCVCGCYGRGVQDYLTKPFSVNELRARVANLLAAKKADDHNRRLNAQLQQKTERRRRVRHALR